MTRESGSWRGKIESISHEGFGVGITLFKHGGKAFRRPIFVPFTVPGDFIVADITEQKRKYLFGEISAVLQESSERVTPKCPHFMTCGGCNLLHVSYDEQLKQKAKQISFLLQRKGLELPYPVKVLPTEQRHNYRWRARIAMQFTEQGCTVGFRKHRSRTIVPVTTCYIVHEKILECIKLLGESKPSLAENELEITAIVGQRGKVGLLVPLDDITRENRQDVKEFFESLYARNRKLIGNVFFSEEGRSRSYGQVQEHFTYDIGDITFSFLPETFIQANIATNPVLIEQCAEFLFKGELLPRKANILDLYAGIGNISLPIAKKAQTVIAVEGNKSTVLAGTTNVIRNEVNNVTFLHQPIERYLREYAKKAKRKEYDATYPKISKIVVDPPRTGLTPGVIRELMKTNVPNILYVSCNPSTLANDLFELKTYKIKEIVGIDMFPDISHVETVVLLEKR